MSYVLKPDQESFEVVDGPHAGRRFEKNIHYADVPDHEAHRFMDVKPLKNKSWDMEQND